MNDAQIAGENFTIESMMMDTQSAYNNLQNASIPIIDSENT
jgi:hypothetical protein